MIDLGLIDEVETSDNDDRPGGRRAGSGSGRMCTWHGLARAAVSRYDQPGRNPGEPDARRGE
jgi:hypothetical protein